MTATVDRRPGTVELLLSGPSDEDTCALRQQLARCLAAGITEIRVDVTGSDDLGLPVLQALHGVAEFLRRRGETIAVVGAGPRVVATMTSSQLEQLLAPMSALAPPRRDRHRSASPSPLVPAPRPPGAPPMTVLASATRIDSDDDLLLARCEPCDQTLSHVEGFDTDVALGTFFHHHPNSGEAVHRPELPAGWRPAAAGG